MSSNSTASHLGDFMVGRGKRRTIGPIPPRGKDGRFLLAEVKDAEGNVVVRDKLQYLAYQPGLQAAPAAIKNLKLFQVDLPPEPYAHLYAKDADDALRVYKSEFGIRRFGEVDPIVTEVGK